MKNAESTLALADQEIDCHWAYTVTGSTAPVGLEEFKQALLGQAEKSLTAAVILASASGMTTADSWQYVNSKRIKDGPGQVKRLSGETFSALKACDNLTDARSKTLEAANFSSEQKTESDAET